jgi:putative transposase
MARRKSTPLRTALSRMFPAALLRRLAVNTGAVRRHRRVDPVKLFWVLILTLAGGRSRTVADLRRSYERVTGVRLSASSFYNRFTPAFARFLKEILAISLENLQRCNEGSKAILGQIQEVLCVDSTVIRLHDTLARRWPACRTNHTLAAVKLHTVINARGRGPQRIKVTSERVHDGPVLRAGRWVQGRLLLFDLGYFRYSLFAAIQAHGGFFLTRLKDNANPTLLRLHRRHRGRAIPVTGLGLRDLRPRLRRRVFDAEAEISFQQRRYAGKRKSTTMNLRVVGLWDEVRQVHHWYITNLPADTVKPEDIGQLYAARWTIELLFRELKTCYQLESMPSRKSHVVEAFLYAAFLTLLASRALLLAIRRWGDLPEERRTPAERWARLLVSAAPDLLALVLDPPAMAHTRERPLLRFFLSEAPDPNSKRKLLPERAGLKIAA